jgi:hypothetical protein
MPDTKHPADPPEMTFKAVGLSFLLALASDGVTSMQSPESSLESCPK